MTTATTVPSHDTDWLIVGGGIVGAAIAWGLARAGQRAMLLDEGDDAFRAARGNFGLVWVQGKGFGHPAYARWTLEAAAAWPAFAAELADRTGVDVELVRVGGMTMCLDDDELAGPDGPLAGLAPGDWELETVSWRGELREAVLWGGAARRRVTRQATLLDGDVERWATLAYRGDGRVPTPTPAPPGPWLHEPDPALIRAGLLDAFATEHGLAPVAPAIAYLTGDATRSPFLRRWPLLEQLPLSIPALQAALDRHDAGPLVLKKRGFPLDPETLRPRLRTGGKRPVTVLIYRDRRAPGGHEHQVCVCGEQAGE